MIFTNNQIKAIFILYDYGFYDKEISAMIRGKNLYNTIDIKIKRVLEKIREYSEDSYYINHICNKVNIEETLKDENKCKTLIDSLEELQEKVKENLDVGFLADDIKNIINIIKNIEKIQEGYNLLVGDIKKKPKKCNDIVMYIGKLKENELEPIVTESIIPEEQWKELQKRVKK